MIISEPKMYQADTLDPTSSYLQINGSLPPVPVPTEPHLAFMSEIPRTSDGAIDLSQLERLPGGGTHDIYKLRSNSNAAPAYLLKVMQRSVGKTQPELSDEITKLTDQYAAFYRVFTPERCLVENRSIEEVVKDDTSAAQTAIVSVVAFDTCFASKDKFGFMVEPLEMDEVIINQNSENYKAMNLALLGSATESFNLENYLSFHKEFQPVFQKLGEDPGLQTVMREFLSKYKQFYQETGILLDTIGLDNVVFYKDDAGWQLKLGSAIKHDTKTLMLKTLAEIAVDPTAATKSFQAETSIYLMPACIRTLNAFGLTLGMGKIIEDMPFTDADCDNLSRAYLQLKNSTRAVDYAKHNDFATALAFFRLHVAEGSADHNNYVRDKLGTGYWQYLKESGETRPAAEITEFLAMLCDPRNQFPAAREALVQEARQGLEALLAPVGSSVPVFSN